MADRDGVVRGGSCGSCRRLSHWPLLGRRVRWCSPCGRVGVQPRVVWGANTRLSGSFTWLLCQDLPQDLKLLTVPPSNSPKDTLPPGGVGHADLAPPVDLPIRTRLAARGRGRHRCPIVGDRSRVRFGRGWARGPGHRPVGARAALGGEASVVGVGDERQDHDYEAPSLRTFVSWTGQSGNQPARGQPPDRPGCLPGRRLPASAGRARSGRSVVGQSGGSVPAFPAAPAQPEP